MKLRTQVTCLVLGFGIVNAIYGGLIATAPTAATDLTAFGFGVVPPVLTLQDDVLEQGCVIPDENVTCDTVAWSTFDPIVGAVSGEKKYTSPSLFELGISNWADLGILFNVNEPSNAEEVTLQDLRLGLFDTQGSLVTQFSLENPTDFLNISQGQGSAGFLITISDDQQSMPFDASLIIGMAAQIGCAATTCDVAGSFGTSGGAESFTVVSLGTPPQGEDPIPEPATLLLMGGGLGAIGLLRYRRKDRL